MCYVFLGPQKQKACEFGVLIFMESFTNAAQPMKNYVSMKLMTRGEHLKSCLSSFFPVERMRNLTSLWFFSCQVGCFVSEFRNEQYKADLEPTAVYCGKDSYKVHRGMTDHLKDKI